MHALYGRLDLYNRGKHFDVLGMHYLRCRYLQVDSLHHYGKHRLHGLHGWDIIQHHDKRRVVHCVHVMRCRKQRYHLHCDCRQGVHSLRCWNVVQHGGELRDVHLVHDVRCQQLHFDGMHHDR